MLSKPLDGVKVVDLTFFIAGPTSAKILADWGADVIKVEPFYGDPGRTTGSIMTCPTENESANPHYSTYNSNKRGLSINLKTEAGMEIMHRLLGDADVFVTSYRTAALRRLGLDYETLSQRHTRLIWAQINGFGDYGPEKDKPGFDTIAYWARSGAMLDISENDSGPLNPPIGFGDSVTGSALAGGIAAALYRQLKTGKGTKVMISLFGTAIWSLSALIVSTQFTDEYPKSRKNAISPIINSYRCRDGKWIFLSILEHERYYNALCRDVFGREDLVDDPRYANTVIVKENTRELIKILEAEFAKYTQDEMVEKLIAADIAHERIQHVKDVLTDEQALANHYIAEWVNRDGSKNYYAMTPVKFDNIEVNQTKDAPLIGENSIEILTELRYEKEEIDKYIREDVITVSNRTKIP
jgi:crotonobetainyl-CoA:carnitine CoA-transferase CaiB-like acyl-CoA transferase